MCCVITTWKYDYTNTAYLWSYQKIKILGFGELKDKIDINADYFSKSAQKKLEKIGGSITPKNKI